MERTARRFIPSILFILSDEQAGYAVLRFRTNILLIL